MFSSEVIYKYMNLLVTGCFGFIGYNFINFLNNHHKNEFNLIGIDALLSTTSKKIITNLSQKKDSFFSKMILIIFKKSNILIKIKLIL